MKHINLTQKRFAIVDDDDYEFFGSQGFQYKMIGNAVPPAMAKNIANAITKVIK